MTSVERLLGQTIQRSQTNGEELEELATTQEQHEDRLDRLEYYAVLHAALLSILALKALGVPTDQLFQYLSLLV